jgi:recombination protein RecR
MDLKRLPSLDKLKKSFQAFPGIGPKSALRMALHILHTHNQEAQALVENVQVARAHLGFCKICNSFTENADICRVCQDDKRDHQTVCIVEDPFVVLMLEQKYSASWVYHVTHGLITPLEKIFPEHLKLDNLYDRLDQTKELIVAFSSSVEGEATATYLKEVIQKRGTQTKLSKIAHGIPYGARLDSLDAMTLEQALEFRQPLT